MSLFTTGQRYETTSTQNLKDLQEIPLANNNTEPLQIVAGPMGFGNAVQLDMNQEQASIIVVIGIAVLLLLVVVVVVVFACISYYSSSLIFFLFDFPFSSYLPSLPPHSASPWLTQKRRRVACMIRPAPRQVSVSVCGWGRCTWRRSFSRHSSPTSTLGSTSSPQVTPWQCVGRKLMSVKELMNNSGLWWQLYKNGLHVLENWCRAKTWK